MRFSYLAAAVLATAGSLPAALAQTSGSTSASTTTLTRTVERVIQTVTATRNSTTPETSSSSSSSAWSTTSAPLVTASSSGYLPISGAPNANGTLSVMATNSIRTSATHSASPAHSSGEAVALGVDGIALAAAAAGVFGLLAL